MSMEKMNSSNIYEMFEEIKKLLKQVFDKLVSMPMQMTSAPTSQSVPIDDVSAITDLIGEFRNLTEEVRKPIKHEHRHIIEIGSSKVFLSMVVMLITILGLSFAIGNQRKTISQYRNNDLKYRSIKMQGQANEENLYQLERWFEYSDTIKIIRKNVERYEQLVREQAEKIERARQNVENAQQLQKEVDKLKRK